MKFLILIFLLLPSFSNAKIKMAITVDDLPIHAPIAHNTTRLEVARTMLAALKRHKVPEVYGFLNGKNLSTDPSLTSITDAWRAAGYPFGNHTFFHKGLNRVPLQEFIDDIDSNEEPLQKLSGSSNWKVFRYPFLHEGNTIEKRNAVRQHLIQKGYQIAQVTIDFEDWAWNAPYARCVDKNSRDDVKWLKETFLQNSIDHLHRAEKLSKALFNRSMAHILLIHIGGMSAEMLEEVLIRYEKEGVEFISLSEALKDEAYKIDPGYTFEWGAEFTYQVMKSRGLKPKDIGLEPYNGYPKAKMEGLCL
jgi:peptidoglycan/xylan/chitin deacetylase (PgdA/CDA1 family)